MGGGNRGAWDLYFKFLAPLKGVGMVQAVYGVAKETCRSEINNRVAFRVAFVLAYSAFDAKSMHSTQKQTNKSPVKSRHP